jgi:hypothetical protein
MVVYCWVERSMPIPPFSIDGVLPPYVGASGPAGALRDMTPYLVTAVEVVSTLGTSPKRKEILSKWIAHRMALRAIGFQRGFQWLDGSFVETKEPSDLDVVTFLHRPASAANPAALTALINANTHIFDRAQAKSNYMLDAFFVDLNGSPETIVSVSRYYLGLFSHRRLDDLWKGMLQVRLEHVTDDAAAVRLLGAIPLGSASAGGSP